MKKLKKALIITIISTVVIAAAVVLVIVLRNKNRSKKSCDVFPMSELSYPSYYYGMDQTSFSGNVTTDQEQRIYLSANEKVSELLVNEGDMVKAGDVIMKYDISAQNLKIETMKAEVEMARVAVLAAQRQLKELQAIVPIEDQPQPEPTPEPEPSTPSDATPEEDVLPEEPIIPEEPQYTREEKNKLIAQKEQEIKTLDISYQKMQVELELLEYKTNNGEVVARFDGQVKLVRDQEEAIMNNDPYIVISGSGDYTVICYIGELSLGSLSVGSTVYAYCYDTGMYYDGIVQDIGNVPTENDYYYYGGAAQSYYPVTINLMNVDGELSNGNYVEVTLDEQQEMENENNLVIPLALVDRENGNYYVMKEVDGKLQKVFIKTGAVYYGSEIEVISGVSTSDYLAIPFAKNAIEGVKTNRKSSMDFYGY